MKVEYVRIPSIDGLPPAWYWSSELAVSRMIYTRRRDAVRGFERFCAAIRRVK